MSDQANEEKIEVVLAVRLPMSVRVLGCFDLYLGE